MLFSSSFDGSSRGSKITTRTNRRCHFGKDRRRKLEFRKNQSPTCFGNHLTDVRIIRKFIYNFET